jgi:hypothetical protein
MKNLALQNLGVLEISTTEMKEINGGLACPGIDWLMGYNSIMMITDDYERKSALDIFFSIWGNP